MRERMTVPIASLCRMLCVRYTRLDSARLDWTWGVTFTHLTYFARMGKLSARFEFIIAFFYPRSSLRPALTLDATLAAIAIAPAHTTEYYVCSGNPSPPHSALQTLRPMPINPDTCQSHSRHT